MDSDSESLAKAICATKPAYRQSHPRVGAPFKSMTYYVLELSSLFLSETLSETKCRKITLFSGVDDLFFTLNLCHARLHTRGCVSTKPTTLCYSLHSALFTAVCHPCQPEALYGLGVGLD